MNIARRPSTLRLSMATAPSPTQFAPLVFAGRLEDAMQALAGSGFSGVEISLRNAKEVDADWLAGRLEAHGLAVSAFASGRMCLQDNLCLCHPDPRVRRKVLDALMSLVKLAARFHAPVIIGGVRGSLSGDSEERSAQRSGAMETLRELAGAAAGLSTQLLLEPINRYETNFINTAQEGLEVIQEIGEPALRLLLDTFHMNIEEADPCSAIRSAGNRLGYLHFADNNRLAPGRGHIDFLALIQAAIESGYSGFISAEVLPIPDDAAAVQDTIQFLSSLTRLEVPKPLHTEGD